MDNKKREANEGKSRPKERKVREKKPYSPPELTGHGQVKELTGFISLS